MIRSFLLILAGIALFFIVGNIGIILYDIPFVLGIDIKSIILLGLSVIVVMLSLSRGKTNILYGTVLLVNLAAYVFVTIFP